MSAMPHSTASTVAWAVPAVGSTIVLLPAGSIFKTPLCLASVSTSDLSPWTQITLEIQKAL